MKVLSSKDAIEMISEGSILMIGGFLGCGTPEKLIDELIASGKKSFTVIANDTAFPDKGIGKLIVSKLVNKVIASHIGTNPETQRQMIEGELEVELVPQGTLAERVRAGGVGLGGILTPTGVGTVVEDGKQKVVIADKEYLLELPLRADYALLKAKRADYYGNLEFSLTARNFNPLMAMAAENVIVEVEEIVPVGSIPPDSVHIPGVLVNYVVVGRCE
ncbi:MAG: branched-chain amino acid dehydrogenase [Thermotogae bacterium]|uniref:CoA transferase subunit A n=1 Tax=Kosmotoga sp. TaxID=1955248 RepID=UPI000F2C817D|nr:3-oxoacid CoA-transferase subunit A [Kosmotoga sp.]MBO8167349.1 3-oxoacid CoA-transferase subunit A [Kosmotoga sp.]MCD6159011.1 3-oxoacid CoA-transferase subunit A [Kosmotoga sp.]RKX49678.1 MAG: branched-chain amino acid dehydrogenase [Thermotogota bacterium]